MPVKLSTVSNLTRGVEVPVGEDTLHVSYRLGAINGKFRKWFTKHGDDDGSLYEMFRRLIAEWDFTDDQDQPLRFSNSELEEIPDTILGRIIQAVMEDAAPGEA